MNISCRRCIHKLIYRLPKRNIIEQLSNKQKSEKLYLVVFHIIKNISNKTVVLCLLEYMVD